MINKKGFTLVELLVVIAIIGILSSVAIVNLNSAREKARIAQVQGNLAALIPSVVLCHDEETATVDGDLTLDGGATTPEVCDNEGTDLPVAGGEICDDALYTTVPTWPSLPAGWTYGVCNSTATGGTFLYSATDTTNTVTCTAAGCVVS